jgi:N-acetyltransferase
MRLEPLLLRGSVVQLEPLGLHHVDALVAASADRSSYGYTNVPDAAESMTHYITTLLNDAAADTAMPFVQRRLADDAVVGCTRFMSIVWSLGRQLPAEVEIGGTWLSATAQRSAVNSEAKLLLLQQAFEVWNVNRVAICTDERNEASRRAIERLGATFEGILRGHRLAQGHFSVPGAARNTATYSILPDEWPAIRDRLHAKLAR